MRDLMARDRPGGGSLHGRHGGSFAVERRELDFERLPVRVHVHHGTHVAHFQALGEYGLRQHDAIVLLDHLEGLLLAGIRGDEPRRRIFPRSMIQTVLMGHCRLS
jgi:hypothetical protein